MVIVEDEYLIFELSGFGIYLYGVKLVYVNGNVDVFNVNGSFVIMGSLMLVNNNSLLVVVIVWYVVENEGNFFMLIGNVVLNFGYELL